MAKHCIKLIINMKEIFKHPANLSKGYNGFAYYEYMLMHTEIFKFVKKKKRKFLVGNFLHFSYFCSKHRLWIHVRTASRVHEYPQSMFWSRNKKNRYTSINPNFTMGFKRVYTFWCFPDV